MEHVKQEVAKNPEKAKDWEKVQKTAASVSAKIHQAKDTVSPGYAKAKDMFSKIKASAGPQAQPKPTRLSLLQTRLAELKTHPAAVKTSDFFSRTSEVLGARVAASMDRFNAVVLRKLQEDERQPELHARWNAQRAARQQQAASAAPAGAAQGAPAADAAAEAAHPHADALTVTEQPKAGGFGLGMEAMPLLTETVSRLLGESEIAQCVREMKSLDANFRLSALQDEMERIVAPQFLAWFLAGDRPKLRAHLGEAAFAAVNSSLQSRLKAGAQPDQRILYGPRDVELRLAIPAEEAGSGDSPCFVFQFVTQQVNCFRKLPSSPGDPPGEIVEGAPDDIRELHYVLAITRNPKADLEAHSTDAAATGEAAASKEDLELLKQLEHPWLIKELAIVGNRRTW